jgi:2-amino-4-hydroxy-6-hydroxymethyldihydropteridine diphosphokinase
MDRIIISDLKARCVLGVIPEERREAQEVVITITLWTDLSQAGESDRIEDAVDYRTLKKQVLLHVEKSQYRLAEALVQSIAEVALIHPDVKQVQVRLEKPSALRFARTVSVEINRPQRELVRAFVSLGSNLDADRNIRKALGMLALQTRLLRLSTVYATEPLGRPEQPTYLNCVAEVMTPAAPEVLKNSVLAYIEKELGRIRTEDKYAPRTIDLDLIAYGQVQLHSPGLLLPDPQIQSRPFLAVPLAELAPDLILPGFAKTNSQIAAALSPHTMLPMADYTQNLRGELHHEFKP